MDQALIQVGLPVSCSWQDCEVTGFVKPQNYGGWTRRIHKKWYCPDHAKEAQEFYDKIVARYKTPIAEPTAESTTEELYKLLD